MKILYLISSFEGGGAGFSIPAMRDVFAALGHELTVVALEPKDMKTAELLAQHNIPHHVLCNKRHSKLSYVFKLSNYLKSNPTDLIWCSLNQACLVGSLVGLLKKIPVVCFKQTDILHWYTKVTWRIARFWVADSQAIADWLSKNSGLPKDKILVWPLFEADATAPEAKVPHAPNKIHLLSIGRLHKMKNYDGLLEALALVAKEAPKIFNSLHVSIVGEGPDREKLEELATKLDVKDKVSFLGHLERDEIQTLTATCDCYIQPSLNEGMCLALHEAMAQGLPAIASAVGQMQFSVVNGKTGQLLKSTGSADIAEALISTLKDAKKLSEMGKNARKEILNFYSHKKFVERGKAVLKTITSSAL